MSNHEKKQRALLMQLFSKHVSPEIAETIWQQREQFLDGGRPRSQGLIATVLFTDLMNFTAVAEMLEPRALMDWLNEYMEAMAQQVIDHRGVIDKYIGDSIMAVFGVPLARKTDAEVSRDACGELCPRHGEDTHSAQPSLPGAPTADYRHAYRDFHRARGGR